MYGTGVNLEVYLRVLRWYCVTVIAAADIRWRWRGARSEIWTKLYYVEEKEKYCFGCMQRINLPVCKNEEKKETRTGWQREKSVHCARTIVVIVRARGRSVHVCVRVCMYKYIYILMWAWRKNKSKEYTNAMR